ncbi:LacI family DNA-binding transcriptional regulator [Pseudoclavibacter sp. 8L]|uniref:LacI family DNA-binding transcriptional regulator n=1 Tax=Pseudoclavibacter sp. 8L TaxID=2653162 RepID=UPI0012F1B56D|nr:LacI family DNA-binding transcriptional regulator [Pseudoclavibacter sp. 8L]VXB08820.1 LacI family transcriptional regulator [Pseudoclavibacter sp. 8L]
MAVSVRDVATLAGVSVGTVSNVLNHPEKVSKATVDKVQSAIEELGFVRNDAARQLRAGESRTVGLIVLDLRNPFFTEVARGAEERAAELGFSVLVANSDEQEERERTHLGLFEEQRVFGVLVTPMAANMPQLERLHKRGTPVVLVDRESADERYPSVAVDDRTGGRIAVEHLLETGHRRVAFLGGPMEIQQVTDRFEGARDAVREVPGATLEVLTTDALSMSEGRRAGLQLAERNGADLPDAVFAANDMLALGLLQSLQGTSHATVPESIALIGYDDIDFAAFASTSLSSIHQPAHLIGSKAMDLLVSAARDPKSTPEHIRFTPELVARASTAPRA